VKPTNHHQIKMAGTTKKRCVGAASLSQLAIGMTMEYAGQFNSLIRMSAA
jgi:hypothetical protein